MWFVHLIHLESLGKSILSSLRFTLYQLVPWLNLLDFHFLLEVSMSKYVKCCTLPDAAYHTSDAPAHRSCSLHQPEQKWMDREMSRNMVEGTSQVVEWKSHRSGYYTYEIIWISQHHLQSWKLRPFAESSSMLFQWLFSVRSMWKILAEIQSSKHQGHLQLTRLWHCRNLPNSKGILGCIL
jgi:hypothetical protein